MIQYIPSGKNDWMKDYKKSWLENCVDDQNSNPMIQVQTSLAIKAPAGYLSSLYCDYSGWGRLFPLTIIGAKLQKEEEGKLTVLVDHKKAGKVINILTRTSANEIRLEEFKPLYSAVFLNRFETNHNFTCYRVIAEVKLKTILKIIEPFIGGLVRNRIRKYVLEPMKLYSERSSRARED